MKLIALLRKIKKRNMATINKNYDKLQGAYLFSEIAKRNTAFAALIASLPLTSILAMMWLHVEGADTLQIADLSKQIFWLVLPSLLLFLLLPLLIKQGLGFWLSLGISIISTIALI